MRLDKSAVRINGGVKGINLTRQKFVTWQRVMYLELVHINIPNRDPSYRFVALNIHAIMYFS